MASPKVALTVDATALGGPRFQEYAIPSRRQCLQCHNASVGFVRSVRTHQLNRLVGLSNQLDEWNKLKIFDVEIEPATTYDAYAAIDDPSSALEKRVRAYFSVNCAHCHNPHPQAMCNFVPLDFRDQHFKPEELVVNGYITPGAKMNSDLYLRMESTQSSYRMPFFGSVLKDEAALTAVGQWINEIH